MSYGCFVPFGTAPRVITVVGPTAAGKSALSVALAQELSGEVAEYQTLARRAIDDILARGRVPLLVGGSGLYIRAVLEEFDFPGTDPQIRARLEAELAATGPAPLYERLTHWDPAAAGKILPSNGRRIVRALEVIELTGRPFTASLPVPTPYYSSVQIGVDRDVEELDARIATRVDRMWSAGLLDEVRGLLPAGLRSGRTAARALGYQQAMAQLDGGLSEEEAKAETVRGTRRFVRRQRSWFRRDPAIVWLDGASGTLVAEALAVTR